MKKVFKRLFIFFIGFPALLAVVIISPSFIHLPLNILVIVFSVLGAVEFRNILAVKNLHISVPEAALLGAIAPVAWTVIMSFGVVRQIVPAAFILGALWLLVSQVFTSHEKLDSCIGRIAAGLSVMIYPGLFMGWIIRMAAFRQAGMVITVFFLATFLNDAAALAAGLLFGKKNRGIVAASPSKSVAGFIGGISASVATATLAHIFVPGAFISPLMPPVCAGIILGLGTGIAATLGDLVESALKRSAGVKDSGTLILGRGGALDSIDSLALAAPIYTLLYMILY